MKYMNNVATKMVGKMGKYGKTTGKHIAGK